MIRSIAEIDWEDQLLSNSVDEAWNMFKTILCKSVRSNTPVRSNQTKKKKNPWITKSTKRSIAKRDKAWKKYRQCRTEANFRGYKLLRNEAGRKVKADQAHYRKRILKSFKGQPKKFYGYMRKLRTVKEKVSQIRKRNGELTVSDVETAQALRDFFSMSLSKKVNTSRNTARSGIMMLDLAV